MQFMQEDRYTAFSITIEQIAKNLQKLKNERMERFGLRSVHVTCLVRLGQAKDGLTGAQLAEYCEVDKSLVSRVLGELEEKGYVYYENCAKKYRRKLYLTEEGKHIFAEVRDLLVESVDAVRGDVSDEDVITFYRVLRAFEKNICSLLSDGASKEE